MTNDNGKLQLKNQEVKIEVDEDTKRALTKGDSTSEVNEPTKYILLDNAFVESVFDERVRHFTKYLNKDEVLQMNDILMHARLIPVVFKAKNESSNKRIKEMANLFNIHAHDHMDNMMALDAKGGNLAKLLVLALKADNQPFPTDKEMKKLFGR